MNEDWEIGTIYNMIRFHDNTDSEMSTKPITLKTYETFLTN